MGKLSKRVAIVGAGMSDVTVWTSIPPQAES